MFVISSLVLGIIALFSAASAVDEHVYTATFDPTLTGVAGSLTMRITNASMVYSYALDFSQFVTGCDITGGLVYHIHSFWNHDSSVTSSTSCGDSFTGGHYDPYLACAPASQGSKDLCVALNRTAQQGYTYTCNSGLYSQGHHYACEVGDLSSKLGLMKPSAGTPNLFEGSHYDPSPPLTPNFKKEAAGIASEWASLVVHCPQGGARMVCASFEFQGVQPASDTTDTGSDANEDDISNGPLAGIIVGSFAALFVVGLAISMYMRKSSRSEHLLRGDRNLNF